MPRLEKKQYIQIPTDDTKIQNLKNSVIQKANFKNSFHRQLLYFTFFISIH
jgi:hypothetical protein